MALCVWGGAWNDPRGPNSRGQRAEAEGKLKRWELSVEVQETLGLVFSQLQEFE